GLAMIILLVVFFVAHYLFASVDAYTTALLPVILFTGAGIPGIPVKPFALLLCMELGIMGIITPFADAASPIYANSGYLPAKDYWRLGTIFGAIYLIVFLSIGIPWGFLFWGRGCGLRELKSHESQNHGSVSDRRGRPGVRRVLVRCTEPAPSHQVSD